MTTRGHRNSLLRYLLVVSGTMQPAFAFPLALAPLGFSQLLLPLKTLLGIVQHHSIPFVDTVNYKYSANVDGVNIAFADNGEKASIMDCVRILKPE